MHFFIRAVLASLLLVFASLVSAEPLDINKATAEQLAEVLAGVGKSKAQAIVQDRERNGNFKSVDDLVRVKGIGKATLEKNRSKITVGGDAQTQSAPIGQSAQSASAAVQTAQPTPALEQPTTPATSAKAK